MCKNYDEYLIICLFLVFANPITSIYESFYPRGYLVIVAFSGVNGALPGKERALRMRHHGQMTSVCTANSCCAEIRTIGIARIFVIRIFQNNVVMVFRHGEGETSLSVCNPNA